MFTFKHALTQEVAYQSLLRQARQQVHHQTAQVLVEHFADTVEARPELVAHHYTEAWLPEQALPYWQQAAERAAGRSAHRETIVYCTRGLAVLATLPETHERAAYELRLQVSLGFAYMPTDGVGAPSAEHALERALELCQRVEDTQSFLMVLRGLPAIYWHQGKLREAQDLAEQHLRFSQQVGDRLNCQKAHLRLGQIALCRGVLTVARTYAEQALSPSQHDGSSEMGIAIGVDIRTHLAQCLWLLGYPDQARACIKEALVLAQTQVHPWSLANALQFAAHIQAYCGAWPAVKVHADALLTLATEQRLAWFGVCALHYRGQALVAQGDTAEGMAQMHRGMAAAQGASEVLQQYFCTNLAEAYGRSGQVEAGLALLADALAQIRTNGRRITESRLYRAQGELLLALSAEQHQAAAERCFHHALAVARQQQAKSLELRAALSLARLWQRQGEGAAAHQVLAEVYGWFTEGLDTADLQEAQALLCQLSVAP
jgi:predicted ATPase